MSQGRQNQPCHWMEGVSNCGLLFLSFLFFSSFPLLLFFYCLHQCHPCCCHLHLHHCHHHHLLIFLLSLFFFSPSFQCGTGNRTQSLRRYSIGLYFQTSVFIQSQRTSILKYDTIVKRGNQPKYPHIGSGQIKQGLFIKRNIIQP